MEAQRPSEAKMMEEARSFDPLGEVFEAGLDRWYSRLESLTFKTLRIAVSLDQAKGMLALQRKYEIRKVLNLHSCARDVEPLSPIPLTPELKGLVSSVDDAIAKIGAGTGAFVKLNSRSPKDVVQLCRHPKMEVFHSSCNQRLFCP